MKHIQKILEFLCLLLALLLSKARGLKLLKLDVPPAADVYSPVTLRCEYDLEGMNLYSVKWYKDGSEFFRFMPDYDPQSQAVKTSVIKVDLQKSHKNKVTLINLRFNYSGNYKCEVSTEGPNFDTVAQSSNMTVMAYPTEDPMIEGVMTTYSVGDYVSANCTSGKSNPPASLNWYINGVKPEKLVWEYRDGFDEKNHQDLQSRTIGLHFQILNSHFTSNLALMPSMEIRCSSTVGDSVRNKTVYPLILRTLTSNKFAQERLKNSAELLLTSSLHVIFVMVGALQIMCLS